MSESTPIVIARYGSEMDAHMARAYLERKGINSFTGASIVTGQFMHMGNALGGVELIVSSVDEIDARKVIQEYNSDQAKHFTTLLSNIAFS
jgi:hypothetical protein